MDTLKLGQLIEGEQHRDAIHIAVAPITAGMDLQPSDRVELVNGIGMKAVGGGIGIVDPFLQSSVCNGRRFWLFLYPNSVTGMRHHWKHPAFECVDARDASERWLRAYAEKLNCYDDKVRAFERLIDGLRSGRLFAYGSDLHGLYDLNDAADLKYHAETYLGMQIDFDKVTFSCSC